MFSAIVTFLRVTGWARICPLTRAIAAIGLGLCLVLAGCYGTADGAASCDDDQLEGVTSCGDLLIEDLDGCGLAEVSCEGSGPRELELPPDWTCEDVSEALGGDRGVLQFCGWKATE